MATATWDQVLLLLLLQAALHFNRKIHCIFSTLALMVSRTLGCNSSSFSSFSSSTPLELALAVISGPAGAHSDLDVSVVLYQRNMQLCVYYNVGRSVATSGSEPQHAQTHGHSDVSMMIGMLKSPIHIFPQWPQLPRIEQTLKGGGCASSASFPNRE